VVTLLLGAAAPRLLGAGLASRARRSAHRAAGGVTSTDRAIQPTPPRPIAHHHPEVRLLRGGRVDQSTNVSADWPVAVVSVERSELMDPAVAKKL